MIGQVFRYFTVHFCHHIGHSRIIKVVNIRQNNIVALDMFCWYAVEVKLTKLIHFR